MKEYLCFKRVKAARITGLLSGTRNGPMGPERHIVGLYVENDNLGVAGVHLIEFAEAEAAKMFARYEPQVGDYLVEYEGGYRSISPRAAFEDGYMLPERANDFHKRAEELANEAARRIGPPAPGHVDWLRHQIVNQVAAALSYAHRPAEQRNRALGEYRRDPDLGRAEVAPGIISELVGQATFPRNLDLENPGDKAAVTEVVNEREGLKAGGGSFGGAGATVSWSEEAGSKANDWSVPADSGSVSSDSGSSGGGGGGSD